MGVADMKFAQKGGKTPVKYQMKNENNMCYGPVTYNFKEVTLSLKNRIQTMFTDI